jgi:hypothetical protein
MICSNAKTAVATVATSDVEFDITSLFNAGGAEEVIITVTGDNVWIEKDAATQATSPSSTPAASSFLVLDGGSLTIGSRANKIYAKAQAGSATVYVMAIY